MRRETPKTIQYVYINNQDIFLSANTIVMFYFKILFISETLDSCCNYLIFLACFIKINNQM